MLCCLSVQNTNGDGVSLRYEVESEITYPFLHNPLLNGESGVMPDIMKIITPTQLTKYYLQLGICIPK